MRVITIGIGILALTMGAAAQGQNKAQTQSESLTIKSLAGKDTFDAYCAPCHGRAGTGNGPVAPVLRTAPADLTRLSLASGTFPREDVVAFVTGNGLPIVAHGTSDMPIWGVIFQSLDPSDIRVRVRLKNVVDYVETLQRR